MTTANPSTRSPAERPMRLQVAIAFPLTSLAAGSSPAGAVDTSEPESFVWQRAQP